MRNPRYSEIRSAGRGGMGNVSICLDRVRGEHVALKRSRAEVVDDPGAARRLEREAMLQAGLRHPAIPAVYDVGSASDPYFTMRFIAGRTLHASLSRARAGQTGALTLAARLAVFHRLCAVVGFVHEHGVLHRDIKPANVILDADGAAHLIDFGLSCHAGATGSEVPRPLTKHFIPGGSPVGTPGYSAPEQLDPSLGPTDERADVYALGALLFELWTLERLHVPGEMEQTIGSTLAGVTWRAEAALRAARAPAGLRVVCLEAIAAFPSQRIASARDLSLAVAAATRGAVLGSEPSQKGATECAALDPARAACELLNDARPRRRSSGVERPC